MKIIVTFLFTILCLANLNGQEITALTYNNGQPFTEGQILTAGTPYTIEATADAATRSVVWQRDTGTVLADSAAPFTFSFTPGATGAHWISATPWTGTNGTGTPGPAHQVNFIITVAGSPTPTPTATPEPSITPSPTPSPSVSPSPSPTVSPSPTASPSPSPTPTATPTATPIPTPSPTTTPTPTPTPIPTPSPSPSPIVTPTPAPVTVGTATVSWKATGGDSYMIFFGKTPTPDIQVAGGTAIRDTEMMVTISGLEPNTTYYFSDIVTNHMGQSQPLPPIEYNPK